MVPTVGYNYTDGNSCISVINIELDIFKVLFLEVQTQRQYITATHLVRFPPASTGKPPKNDQQKKTAKNRFIHIKINMYDKLNEMQQ